MAIFKKKASKDRELGARSPSASPPVTNQSAITSINSQDLAGGHGSSNAITNVNGRRLTSNPLQFIAPGGRPLLSSTPNGRNSPSGVSQGQVGPGNVGSLQGAANALPVMNGLPQSPSVHQGQNQVLSQGYANPQAHGPQNQVLSNPGYPWSTRQLKLFAPPASPPTSHLTPFPRYGLSVPSYPSHSGHILIFGGLAHDRAQNDLWSVDVRDCSLQQVRTRGEAPLPRIGHVSAIADRIMLIFGGDTKVKEDDKQDDGLYVLNLRTQEWSSVPVSAGPSGRYGHAACMHGTTFYVHGGNVDGRHLDDLWAFDINQLGQDSYKWDHIQFSTPSPMARTGHTLVPYMNKLYLFGGTDGDYHYNDSWSLDLSTGAWTELGCIGYIPSPREGHASAIVDDVIYVFGGRDVHGKDLGDLGAFRISNQRWYMFQNMGPTPMAKSGHSLCAAHGKVFVLGGESNLAPSVPRDDPNLVHVLDTTKIKYPVDNQLQRPIPRPQTTSDAANNQINQTNLQDPQSGTTSPVVAPVVAPRQLSESDSRESLSRAMTPSEQHGVIPSNSASKLHTRSESQDTIRLHGAPPQRPRRDGDEEFRRAMSPVASGPHSPRNINGNISPVTQTPVPPHASHTIHPNLRNTKSPPPQSRPGENGDRPALPPDAFYFGGKSPTSNGFGSRPTSIMGRPTSSRPNSISGTADLLRELKIRETEAEGAKRREAALRVILSLALQQGFVADGEVSDVQSELLEENDSVRRLAEALIKMKQEKAEIQNEMTLQAQMASSKLVEAERREKGALQEAAFYRAKVSALDSGSSDDLKRVEQDRIEDLERQIVAIAIDHAESKRDHTLLQDECHRYQALHAAAHEREDETLKRAEAAETGRAQLLDELEGLRQKSMTVEMTTRDYPEKLIALTSSLQIREAERDQFQAQLEDALSKRDEHLHLIDQAQSSIASAGMRVAVLEGMHDKAMSRITQLEEELAETRLDLESRSREAGQAAQRLIEVENAYGTSREEADSLRAVTTGRLKELIDSHRTSRVDEDRITKGHQDQLRALEEEKSSLLRLLREAGQRVDAAESGVAAHRQKTREVESAHQALLVEMRVHRTKLISAHMEINKFRGLYSAKDGELHERDQAVIELQTRVSLLQNLLREHGVIVNDDHLENIQPISSDELEMKLREKTRAYENVTREVEEITRRYQEAEARIEALSILVEQAKDFRDSNRASMQSTTPTEDAERRLKEAEALHKEKIATLEGDYQTAVRYVKGTEKMLKRMKDELNKQKLANSTLMAELDGLRGRSPSTEPGARTRDASGRNTQLENDVARRLQTLINQHTALQAEYQAAQDVGAARGREVELLRMRSEETMHENEVLRDNLAQAQRRITTLLEMNNSGVHLGGDNGEGLDRDSSASSDEASMAFDKFSQELKEWERARSPAAGDDGKSSSKEHRTGNETDDGNESGIKETTAHSRSSSAYSGNWVQ